MQTLCSTGSTASAEVGDRVQEEEARWCPMLEPGLMRCQSQPSSHRQARQPVPPSPGALQAPSQMRPNWGKNYPPSFSPRSPLAPVALQRHQHHPRLGPGSICAAKGEIQGGKRSCRLPADTKDRQKNAQLKQLMVCLFVFAIFDTSPNQECLGCCERCQLKRSSSAARGWGIACCL